MQDYNPESNISPKFVKIAMSDIDDNQKFRVVEAVNPLRRVRRPSEMIEETMKLFDHLPGGKNRAKLRQQAPLQEFLNDTAEHNSPVMMPQNPKKMVQKGTGRTKMVPLPDVPVSPNPQTIHILETMVSGMNKKTFLNHFPDITPNVDPKTGKVILSPPEINRLVNRLVNEKVSPQTNGWNIIKKAIPQRAISALTELKDEVVGGVRGKKSGKVMTVNDLIRSNGVLDPNEWEFDGPDGWVVMRKSLNEYGRQVVDHLQGPEKSFFIKYWGRILTVVGVGATILVSTIGHGKVDEARELRKQKQGLHGARPIEERLNSEERFYSAPPPPSPGEPTPASMPGVGGIPSAPVAPSIQSKPLLPDSPYTPMKDWSKVDSVLNDMRRNNNARVKKVIMAQEAVPTQKPLNDGLQQIVLPTPMPLIPKSLQEFQNEILSIVRSGANAEEIQRQLDQRYNPDQVGAYVRYVMSALEKTIKNDKES